MVRSAGCHGGGQGHGPELTTGGGGVGGAVGLDCAEPLSLSSRAPSPSYGRVPSPRADRWSTHRVRSARCRRPAPLSIDPPLTRGLTPADVAAEEIKARVPTGPVPGRLADLVKSGCEDKHGAVADRPQFETEGLVPHCSSINVGGSKANIPPSKGGASISGNPKCRAAPAFHSPSMVVGNQAPRCSGRVFRSRRPPSPA